VSGDRDKLVKSLAALRIVVGSGSFLAPGLTGATFGIDASRNPQVPYVARLFGVRDVALAYGALTSSGAEQDRWIVAGIASDLGDAVAGAAAGRGGYLGKPSTVLVTAMAVGAVAMGAAALRS
jgi:hypothetical protein